MSLAMQNQPPVSHIFDQWLLDVLLDTPSNSPVGKGTYLALRAVRQLRLALSDPVVIFPLGSCRLCLPLSHELPFYKKRFPEYARNLGRVSFHVSQKYPNLTMIDVGANVGDSVAVVRMFSEHAILCIEGEPRFFKLLAQNTRNLRDLELEQTFIGAAGDHVSGIHREPGNAQVRLGPGPTQASICTLSEVLARHPRFASAKLLKLDAEGFDCKIIAAEAEFLRCNKPVLFFEYFPKSCETAGHQPFAVFPQLRELGYFALLIYQNFGNYFMSLSLDQVDSLLDLHDFLVDLQGFCDVVAFHREDLDIAAAVRGAERAGRARKFSATTQA